MKLELKPIRHQFTYGKHQVILETRRVARQAYSVWVDMDGTIVSVSLVAEKNSPEPRGFLPLSVHFAIKSYAGGKIPGGFMKRESRPSPEEVIIARETDRALRPLFPKNFYNEVQITATVLSVNPEIGVDIPTMLGASAAVQLAGLPVKGVMGAARVGYIDGNFILNPSVSEEEHSALDLVVAGTSESVVMVESEAHALSEQIMLEGVLFGHTHLQEAIQAINAFVQQAGVEPFPWEPSVVDTTLQAEFDTLYAERIRDAYAIQDKQARQAALSLVRSDLSIQFEEHPKTLLEEEFHQLEAKIVRQNIIKTHKRIDGRDLTTVRPIAIETGLLTRAHGSALFTRGETQALVVTTLGTEKDAQQIDSPYGESKDTFMLHYNFPAYCVGELGMPTSPKRREIGHGRLARRAVEPMLPDMKEFPYVLRVVSEVMESNGSSSMATVCGTSLALMDAGVPLKAPVAGIAMGLIQEGSETCVLTDILGDEDHLGDMDFKVAGTAEGVTALQMDIKIDGITRDILEKALLQARDGRLHILGLMDEVLPKHRADISDYAPRITTFKISQDKIREVIGKGGVTIRSITEETKVVVEIEDDGTVKLISNDAASTEKARQKINDIIAEVEVGKIYEGTVVRVVDFGAFVSVLNGKEGLVHISQIANERVNNVSDWLSEGQKVTVKAIEIDRQGRLRLSMKEAQEV